MWLCRCSCGCEAIASTYSLTSGKKRSCGCLQKEAASTIARKYRTKHNQTNSRLYNIWLGMKSRTMTETHRRYEDYGGRGITVCPEWRDSFEAFRDWALTSGYQDGLSLDRMDNDGPYSPGNCRWATRFEQGNNKRNNLVIEFAGEKHTLSEWSEITGINYSTLKNRFYRGWDPTKALDPTPAVKKKQPPL